MNITTYPTTAWRLLPSFKPAEVTLVRRQFDHSYPEWHATGKGPSYHSNRLHPTKHAAIAAGRTEVAKLEADLLKRRASLNKRIATLDKAEAEASPHG